MRTDIPAVRIIGIVRSLLGDGGFLARHRASPADFARVRKLPFSHVVLLVLRKSLKSLPLHLHEFFGRVAARGDRLLEPVRRRDGLPGAGRRLRRGRRDHAMWVHRPDRAEEGTLYAEQSPSAQGGRGLGLGRMFTADGTLVATVAQEGMVRVPD